MQILRRARLIDAAPWLLLIVAAAYAVWVHFAVPVLPYDDAYITFRYVKQLYAGNGLVYNTGERVLGSSSPLYLSWLIVLQGMFRGFDVPTLAVRSNVIWMIASALSLRSLIQRISPNDRGNHWLASLAAAALLANADLLVISTGGMEPFFFLTWVLLALNACLDQRSVRFGIFTGLAILARPEGILLAPPGALLFWNQWRALARAAVTALLTVIPWLIFATIYYGSPVPQSVIAKSRPIYALPPGATALRQLSLLSSWITGTSNPSTAALMIIVAGILFLMLIASFIFRPLRRAAAPGLLFAAILALHAIGNPLHFEWYEPPIYVMSMTFVIAFILFAAQSIGARGYVALNLLALLFISRVAWSPSRTTTSAPLHRESIARIETDANRARILGYQAAAQQLTPLLQSADTVAAPEIGALGYSLNARILDPCGLVTPQALPFLPIPRDQQTSPEIGAISVQFTQATQPTWIVSLPAYISQSLLRSQWFAQHYELALEIPLPPALFRGESVAIYRLRIPPSPLSPSPPRHTIPPD